MRGERRAEAAAAGQLAARQAAGQSAVIAAIAEVGKLGSAGDIQGIGMRGKTSAGHRSVRIGTGTRSPDVSGMRRADMRCASNSRQTQVRVLGYDV